jgi:ankyrin repeat protein
MTKTFYSEWRAEKKDAPQVMQPSGAGHRAADTEGFFRAAAAGDGKALREMIAAGAPLDQTDRNGDTALMVAVQKKQLKIVADLIAAGADAECRNRDGRTARALAVQAGDPGVTALLSAVQGSAKTK